ncbi:MAG: ATP-binding cassette domain-containing protein [Candidatus Dormibacteraeota bacterium]|nr:ATP-binding cassette domain-containing protein [Candidatus Dormibacteraeota bacterium]
MSAGHAITAEGIVKRFGQNVALDGLDLEVAQGSLYAMLGPNGAGKTTAVRIFTTLLKPDAGRASVAGYDVVRDADRLKSSIGLAGQDAAIDERLTGRENLLMIGQLYHLAGRDARQRAIELLEQFDLIAAADRVARTYSGGMRRRLDLAASLVVLPPVLFLDEPTTGLDPRSRRQTWDIIQSLANEGATILLTTQYLEEADELAHRIAVVDAGRVIAEGTSDELKSQVGGDRIEVSVSREADFGVAAEVVGRHVVGDPTLDVGQRRLSGPSPNGTRELSGLVRDLDAASIEITDLQLRRPSLDDVFLTLTGHQAEEEPLEVRDEKPRRRWGRR